MQNFKKFGVLVIAVFALSAIGAASASAATFTASATGSLSGKATATQEFGINAGTVRCGTALSSGTIVSTASPEQHVSVTYSSCTAFAGFIPVHNIEATYVFTADGKVHIKNQITITVTAPFGTCHVTVPGGQTVSSVTYANLAGGKMSVTPNITGITYSTTGGTCGSGGTNGTYKGANEVERVGGGSISWDK
jgi:hypothetical protein